MLTALQICSGQSHPASISWVQRGTQPGLKQKSQAIYQAADADSLNSLAQKLLQTRPLLQKKKDSTTGFMIGIFGSSHA